MNIALWIAQGLLVAMYLMAGIMKTFQTEKVRPTMTWTQGRSDAFVRFVGISELLGALGMVLPMVTGILPWLTPIAAIGLALIQLLAIVTEHLPKKEFNIIPMNVVLLGLSIFVIFGRWVLFS
jgi:uncharacterized membrane protein YphA (DoxX/SURF4 family)